MTTSELRIWSGHSTTMNCRWILRRMAIGKSFKVRLDFDFTKPGEFAAGLVDWFDTVEFLTWWDWTFSMKVKVSKPKKEDRETDFDQVITFIFTSRPPRRWVTQVEDFIGRVSKNYRGRSWWPPELKPQRLSIH